jgi:putative ABC transport system substrate-binding protein
MIVVSGHLSVVGDNTGAQLMNGKIFLWLLTAVLLGIVSAAAQQSPKISRIGFLTAGSPSTIPARIEAFRQGLRELGYVEDKNIVIEWRFGEGKPARLPELVAELVRLKVDVILSAGAAVTRPAKAATRTIPVGNGFVASLARPGGNITGLSSYSAELNGKRLELLKEIVPKLSRLVVVGESTYPGNAQSLKETELAAGELKVHVQYLDVLDPKEIETAFRQASKGRADGVLMLRARSSILSENKLRTLR